jgi:hypothetical protein
MPDTISVVDWTTVPSDGEIANLKGSILHIMVDAAVGPSPTPWGEFFRFARVISVDCRPEHLATCVRCERQARWQIGVQWEAGYQSPDGDLLCESCIDGLVTDGEQLIAFNHE